MGLSEETNKLHNKVAKLQESDAALSKRLAKLEDQTPRASEIRGQLADLEEQANNDEEIRELRRLITDNGHAINELKQAIGEIQQDLDRLKLMHSTKHGLEARAMGAKDKRGVHLTQWEHDQL